jgi:hypothetical protein
LLLFQVESLVFDTINKKSLWVAGISKVIPSGFKCQVGSIGLANSSKLKAESLWVIRSAFSASMIA